eukprot:5235228-Amphidinium_carterae.1
MPRFPSLVQGGARHNHSESTTYVDAQSFLEQLQVTYDPEQALAPHCLFACALRLAAVPVTLDNIRDLRADTRQILQAARDSNERIAGHCLQEWLLTHPMDIDEYITATTQGRLGTSLDLV